MLLGTSSREALRELLGRESLRRESGVLERGRDSSRTRLPSDEDLVA